MLPTSGRCDWKWHLVVAREAFQVETHGCAPERGLTKLPTKLDVV
jgi:hypothetical protein